MKTFASLLFAFAVFFWNTAFAKERVDQRRALKANGTFVVNNVSGSVKIMGVNEESMSLSGELGDGVAELEIVGEGDRVEVSVKTKGGAMQGDGSAELEIRVPKTARVEVRCVSADVSIGDLSGVARVETVSGEISINGVLKSAEVKTVSGDIAFDGAGERLEIGSVSGDIVIKSVNGELEAQTVSGDIRVGSGRLTRVRMKSVSGDVNVRADFAGTANSHIESHSGDVELQLSSATSATFEASTFSGTIRADGNKEREKKARWSVGDGTAKVDITTFSGDVRVQKN
jgi:DUF4097 and DUF4098 domain-containing protein YvlB